MINVLRFIGAIDKDGKQSEKAASVFYQSGSDFEKGFELLVQAAYKDLFDAYKETTWDLPSEKLIAFFRSKDKTTALVGKLQAATFQLLAGLSGHGAVPEPSTTKQPKPATKPKVSKPKPDTPPVTIGQGGDGKSRERDFGLTVRIEVNLPPSGDQETYDRIFRSIRENLLNAPKP